jgi:sugar lactone lactonase YvrE
MRTTRPLVLILLMASLGSPGLVLPAGAGQGHSEARPIGQTNVFARVLYPGQPAGIVVDGDTVYVSGAGFATEPVDDWAVWAFDLRTGRLKAEETKRLARHMPVSFMGLTGMAKDAEGRLYVVDMNGRILRTKADKASWEVYAALPTHGVGMWPAGTMPMDIVFDSDGNAYVTDTNFPGIWRVSPGGSKVDLWFKDLRLLSYPLGSHGITLGPDRRLYIAMCVSEQAESPAHGVVFRLSVDSPDSSHFEELFRYPPGSCAVGVRFGNSGKLYVTLGGLNQVSILRPDGTEELRFPSPAENARQEVSYDFPFMASFDGDGSLLVTNAAPMAPERWAVLRAFVNDTAFPLPEPSLP